MQGAADMSLVAALVRGSTPPIELPGALASLEPVALNGSAGTAEENAEARDRIMSRFEHIGTQIMRRSGSGGPFEQDPIAGVLADPDKRSLAAQLLGQAYMRAHALVEANRRAVEHIADVLVERRELHGDEVLELLDSSELRVPDVDLTKDETWPIL